MIELAAVLSVVMFVASVALVPWMIVRLPAEYFRRDEPLVPLRDATPRQAALRVARNLAGLLLLLAGIAALVLPGQGLLTILASLLLLDFPGKHALERRLIARPTVRRAADWIRVKGGREPFEL